jgi:hypothetical protein
MVEASHTGRFLREILRAEAPRAAAD